NGTHSFVSLRIINGGVLTHSVEQKIEINVAGEVEIDAGSKVDVSGRGLLGDLASGIYTGGSHGGRGGDYSSNNVSGASYGNYQQPVTLGRGGRTNGTGTAARGGGAIKIVAEELNLEGGIFANGLGNSSYGGGAGGSIWLDVGILRSV